MATAETARNRAKNERRAALLREAARLFAESGYSEVTLEEIGGAVGISGPAVYRHFAGKQALLGAVLIDISQRLYDRGLAVTTVTDPVARLDRLIASHVTFALAHPDVIRVHDRDLSHLRTEDHSAVRRLQRGYIDLWIDAVSAVVPAPSAELRLRVQASFGLINSTPHSTSAPDRKRAATSELLSAMARAALTAPSRS